MLSRFSYLNPAAEKIRVMYTGTSVIYEGMPVCFDYDSTTNIDGYDRVDGAGSTTDEGHQNEGKYIRVEDPADNNIMHFAGVVAGPEYQGVTGTGEKWLEIYIPNGAIVPVRCDVDTTTGVTLLAITAASQEFGQPVAGTSRVVALAMETETALDTTADITLAKLDANLSLYQDLDGTALSAGAYAGAVTVNSVNLTFGGTGGPKRGLYAVGEITAAGHSAYGMWKFRTYLNAAAAANVHTLCANLHLKDSAELTNTPEYASSAIYATVETESTAGATSHAGDLSGGDLALIYGGYYVKATGGNPASFYWFSFNSQTAAGFDAPNGLIKCQQAADIGLVSNTDTVDYAIPIKVGGTTYYIAVTSALS